MTSLNLNDLPNDIDSLKEIIKQNTMSLAKKDKELSSKDKELSSKDKELSQSKSEIKQLKFINLGLEAQLEKHLRYRFGQRSEKNTSGQMWLFKDAEATHTPPPPDWDGDETEKKTLKPPKRQKPSEKMPELPTVREEHTLTEEDKHCGTCHKELKKFSEESSEELKYIPAKVIVIKHARFVYGCPDECEGSVKKAAKPLKVIPKSHVGIDMLTQILVSKFNDHLPYYRQNLMFGRLGVDLPRSSMGAWMMKCAELLSPIAEYQLEQILSSGMLHTDDTTVPVQNGKGRTRTGRLWVYLGDKEQEYVYFRYSPDRKGERVEDVLENYEGYVQADAYAGYDFMFNESRVNRQGKKLKPATEVGCMAHNRRYFWEAWSSDPTRVQVAIDYFKALYKIEREIKNSTDDERRSIRQRRAKPILENFYSWLKSIKEEVFENASFTKALNYAMNHKEAMFEYLNDGRLNIDNNPAERALRCVAVGRKNWMFAGNDRAGKAAAVFYSLIETCKLHGINVTAYIHDALMAMADCRDQGNPQLMKTFTPLYWKNLREKEKLSQK